MKVGKVNVHDNFDLANEYGVMSIPRVFLFQGGKKPVKQVAGFVPEAELARLLESVVKAKARDG